MDNFIARTDGAVDWLMWSDEAGAIMSGFFEKIDTILMGRKTYEVALEQSKGQKNPYPRNKNLHFFADFERSKGAEIVSENAVEFVRDLKASRRQRNLLDGWRRFCQNAV